jgi:hypothetical protein
MSAKNSEISGDEWIVPSLVESEYVGLIFPEEPISPEDLDPRLNPQPDPISPEYPIPPEGLDPQPEPIPPEGLDPRLSPQPDPISPEYRIPQESRIPPGGSPPRRDPDPITGNPPVNGTPSTVTRLSNPEFRILIDTTRPNEYKVEGTVTVEISEEDLPLFTLFPLRLQSTLWGEDSGANEEDELFSFTAQRITAPGTYNFSAFVHRGTLNEDNTIFDRRDEVYNKFSIVSGSRFLQSPNIHIQSRTEHGYFG